ncbi:hypothetical protein CCP2SC5_770011 [Azospirillaceae bacterium]
MGFWIVAATMTAGVAVLMLTPLLRSYGAPPSRVGYDRMVYRDQLAEIDRDLTRGVLDAAQAEAARVEIARRLLATGVDCSESAKVLPTSLEASRRLAFGLGLFAPVATLAIYLPMGRPDLPDAPLSARVEVSGASKIDELPPDVVLAVEGLAKHLEKAPDDVMGWLLLGKSYQKMNRIDDAVRALRKARDLAPEDSEIVGFYAESLVVADQGMISEEARQVFESMLKRDSNDFRARYYLASARVQAGDAQGALKGWREMLAVAPKDAPWLSMVQRRIEEITGPPSK